MKVGFGLILRWTAFAVAAVLAAGCAHVVAPTGGDVPDDSPRLVEARPAPLSIVGPWDGYVSFQFDRTLSERGVDGAVLVSPETGDVRVRRRGSELRVTIDGGWQPGHVYRVEVQPGIQDRYNNVRQEAIELVFSTGPELVNTAVAGLVVDRITTDAVAGARVEAVRADDDVTYVARTDSAGFFTFRHVPEGRYALRAYEDRNRNRQPDPFEPVDTANANVVEGDTLVFGFSILVPDTVPARLMSAEALDSLHIRIAFDDYLDPDHPLDGVEASLWALPDSVRVDVAEVLYPHEHEARQREAERAIAAAEAEAVPPDTAGVDPPAFPLRPERAEGAADDADSGPLPARELVIVSAVPLEPLSRYRVEVGSVRNIADVPDGGGSVVVETPARPEPEPETDPRPERETDPRPGPETDPPPEPDAGTPAVPGRRPDGA